jgi:putative hydroxymethylpyrimidine transport system substrate-binding protein
LHVTRRTTFASGWRAAAFALTLAATPAVAQEKLTVLLDWFVNPDHAALVVAQQGGYFKRAGLDVTLVEPADPSAPPKLVAAGQGDIAVSYQPNLYLQVKEELPVRRIGGMVDTPLNSLVVLADGPVKSIGDLRAAPSAIPSQASKRRCWPPCWRAPGSNCRT